MAKKRYNAEEIIHKLREADVLLSQGKSIGEACKQLGVSEQTYYRWRKSYGGMKVDQAKRLKALKAENARLKRAVADLTVDKLDLPALTGPGSGLVFAA
jgi:transposase-like protein